MNRRFTQPTHESENSNFFRELCFPPSLTPPLPFAMCGFLPTDAYLRVKTVGGRTDNEPTFYFNATTNESTFDKPQELMLPEELAEHKKFLEYKETSEK